MWRIAISALVLALSFQSSTNAHADAAHRLINLTQKKEMCLKTASTDAATCDAILAQSQCGAPGCCSTSKCICERKPDGSVGWCASK